MGKYSIFGVNLEPKETRNKQNVIKVTSKEEIFFDVFECKINGQKVIVEKIGEYSGLPVVKFELKIDNSFYSCEAMLVEGKQSDLFLNEETLKLTKKIQPELAKPVQKIITEKNDTTQITNFKSTKKISEEIINESQKNVDILKQNKLEHKKKKQLEETKQAEEYLNEKAENIKNDLKEEYIDFLATNDTKVKNLIELKIEEINNLIDENIGTTISKINESSNSTKKDFLKILSENINKIDKKINGKIEDLNDSLELFLNDNSNKVKKLEEKTNSLLKTNVKNIEKNISSKVKEINERVDDYRVDTLKTVVEKVAENKSQIETSLKNTISKINEKVDLKSSEVEKILSEELTNINKKLNIFSQEEDKKYKQLLENLNNLNKGEVKEILSEKISDSQINSLKLDIKQQFQNEIGSMKRYAEMSAGGGTNAVQYANGGTMNGNLNVNGELKADTILATTLLSAGTMDINFELSGFSVTGDLSASGSIEASGFTSTDDISAKDIIKSGRLNVGSGNLFVDDGTSTGNAFVKMGAYGAGNFFGKDGSVNGATFSLGVGSAGKIVEDMRIDTFALSGAGLVNKKTNPVVLVTTPGANKYIVPVSIQVYKSQSGGTRIPWPTGTGATAFGIGTFANSANTGVFSGITALPRTTAIVNGDWLYTRYQGPDTTNKITSNRDLCLRGFLDMASNTSADVIYLKVRYMVMSEDGDFKSIANLQIKDT
jgi:hypothetical protein